MSSRVASLAALVILAFVAVGQPAASARASAPVALSASATTVQAGQSVTLTVKVDPPAAGEQVAVLDDADNAIASGVTDSTGAFVASYSPTETVTLHATWQGASSEPVKISVVAAGQIRITLHAAPVRLFGSMSVRGQLKGTAGPVPVKVELLLHGKPVATKNVTASAAGRFATGFRIMRPGSYRARATVQIEGAPSVRAATTPHRTALPDLAVGARGDTVLLLERRLVELHYHLTGIDVVYDLRTADAVMAFRKVQRLPRVGSVSPAVWRALSEPKAFVPRSRAAGRHIEIDQTRQVLAMVEAGRVTAIVHVSTGKPSTPTPDGMFHVFSKLAGYSSKGLYYPSFFNGERAIHGWPDVPTYAASHGCVRIPDWEAIWVFGQDPLGTTVIVYH